MYKKEKMLFFMATLQSGGGERVMTDLMNHFSKKGHEVILVVIKNEGVYASSLNNQIKIIDLKQSSFTKSMFLLINIMRKHRPSVVFSSYVHLNPVLVLATIISGVKAKKILRVGIPLSLTFERFSTIKDKIILPMLSKLLYKRASVVIAVSKGIALDTMKTLGLKKEKVSVIYSPKDKADLLQKAGSYIPNVFSEKKGPYIVYVGRFVEQKAVEVLVRAFGELSKSKYAHLVLVGDGSEKEKLIKIATEYNVLDRVSFEGTQENPFVYLKNADMFVLPSRWEGLPNVLVEAMVCEVPIITTDSFIGGSREVVSPNTIYIPSGLDRVEETDSGYIVPVDRVDLLADAMSKCIERKNFSFDSKVFEQDVAMAEYERVFLNEV